MNREQVFETVKKYILEQLPVDASRVTENAKMIDDLGADSANLMMLVMDLEAEFDLTVDDDAIGTIRTVGDIVDAIVKAKPSAAKGTYLKSCTVTSTMGVGVKVSTTKYGV